MLPVLALAQESARQPLLEPADTFNRTRFWVATGVGTTLYTSAAIGLYHAWYKNYEQSGFHTFNDAGEWQGMDKMGHLFTAYIEGWLIFQGARWTGMNRRSAIWTGVGGAMLLQTTVEVMDGFSEKWGFSWTDMAFNALGAGLFASQEFLWEEQRIWMKVSNTRPAYSTQAIYAVDGGAVTTPRDRAYDLFGSSFAEYFLKDYNGQTIWFSVNPHAFIAPKHPQSRFPRWLNIAAGYGAMNMYGGYDNSWTDDQGNFFTLPPDEYPRYRQFYLSLDIDLTRIRTRSRVLKVLLGAFNWIKIPSPTLEINSLGKVKFHPLFW